MGKTTCLITGGNSGIGKAAATQLAERGCRVLIACRNAERGKLALQEIKTKTGSADLELLVLDLSSQKSIRSSVDSVNKLCSKLDVLIHNAADFDISRKRPLYSPEGIETVWAANHVGPVLLTDVLLPILKKDGGGRIITVASQGLMMHPFLKVSMTDPEFRGRKYSVEKAYYQSKLAQVMYTYWLSERLMQDNITVNCVRVTNVKIDISRYPGLSDFMKSLYAIKSKYSITPEAMAKVYTDLALDGVYGKKSGRYYDENLREVKSSSYSMRKENIDELMRMTYSFIK